GVGGGSPRRRRGRVEVMGSGLPPLATTWHGLGDAGGQSKNRPAQLQPVGTLALTPKILPASSVEHCELPDGTGTTSPIYSPNLTARTRPPSPSDLPTITGSRSSLSNGVIDCLVTIAISSREWWTSPPRLSSRSGRKFTCTASIADWATKDDARLRANAATAGSVSSASRTR